MDLQKRYCCIKMSCFPPYDHSKSKIEVELDFSNYAVKSDLIWLEIKYLVLPT